VVASKCHLFSTRAVLAKFAWCDEIAVDTACQPCCYCQPHFSASRRDRRRALLVSSAEGSRGYPVRGGFSS